MENENRAVLCGTIHGINVQEKQGGMEIILEMKRLSGTSDYVPVSLSAKTASAIGALSEGMRIRITGKYLSFNVYDQKGSHLMHHVAAETVGVAGQEEADENDIHLTGYLCRKPSFQITPLCRKLTEIMVAVNNSHASYIPCLLWNRNAAAFSNLEVGACLKICGRIQSRTYVKAGDPVNARRTVCEVSVYQCSVMEKDTKKEEPT